MKRIVTLGLLALVLTATGCLQLESNAVIEKDGSGTLDITFTVPLDVEQALRELSQLDAGMDEDMGTPPMFDENFDISELKADLSPHGVEVKDYVNGVEGDSRVTSLTLAFKDVDGMQAALEGAGGSDGAMGIRRMSDGNFYLGEVEASYHFDEADEEEAYEEPSMEDLENMDMGAAMQDAARSMELMGVLMSRASDLSLVWRITVPGDVIRHNAQQVEGRTCVWAFDSSGMMSGSMESPEVVFSSQGVKIDAPDM